MYTYYFSYKGEEGDYLIPKVNTQHELARYLLQLVIEGRECEYSTQGIKCFVEKVFTNEYNSGKYSVNDDLSLLSDYIVELFDIYHVDTEIAIGKRKRNTLKYVILKTLQQVVVDNKQLGEN